MPSPIWKQRHYDVLAELKLRMKKAKGVLDDKAKQEAARLLVSKQETCTGGLLRCVGPDALYRNEIVGMDDETREKMHLLYTARWTYFHTDVFTAAKFLDSEYIKDEYTEDQGNEFRNVLS